MWSLPFDDSDIINRTLEDISLFAARHKQDSVKYVSDTMQKDSEEPTPVPTHS
jgi:hypothetical protein